MSETLKFSLSSATFKIGTRITLVLLALIGGLSRAAVPSGKPDCEIFLASGIPLSEGVLPEELQNLVLVSKEDVAGVLAQDPKYPWRADFAEITDATFANGKNLIYLSEIGPTLWDADHFSQWTKAILELNNDPLRARDLLIKLAFGENVPGLSAESGVRIRNSLLAREEELKTQDEATIKNLRYWSQQHQSPEEQAEFLRNLNQISHQPHGQRQLDLFNKFAGGDKELEIPPDPISGEAVDLSKVDPMYRDLFVTLSFEREANRSGHRAAWEMREASPSLSVLWKSDLDLMMQITDISERPRAQALGGLDEGIWVTRTILREALVRRKMSGGRLFGETRSDDEIFYLAAFPEFLPAWPQSAGWIRSIRNEDLDSGSEFYSSTLSIPINGQAERVYLEVGRDQMYGPVFSEAPSARIFVARYEREEYFSPERQRAVAAWLQSEWQEFTRHYDLKMRATLTLSQDDETVVALLKHPYSSRLIIAFFAFLTEKYPGRSS